MEATTAAADVAIVAGLSSLDSFLDRSDDKDDDDDDDEEEDDSLDDEELEYFRRRRLSLLDRRLDRCFSRRLDRDDRLWRRRDSSDDDEDSLSLLPLLLDSDCAAALRLDACAVATAAAGSGLLDHKEREYGIDCERLSFQEHAERLSSSCRCLARCSSRPPPGAFPRML
jgi:hypothetical protein